MNMDLLYYVLLFVTVITYLIGLFLSQFEKKESLALSTSSRRFTNTFEMSPIQSNEIKKEDEII